MDIGSWWESFKLSYVVDLTGRAGGKKPLPRLILLLAMSVSNAGEELAAGMKVHADSLP